MAQNKGAQAKAAKGKPLPQKARAAQPPMPESHLEHMQATAMLRNVNFRERHYFLMRTCMVLAGCLCLSVGSNIMQAMQPPVVKVVLSTGDGKVKEIVTVDRPNMSNADISTWLASAVVSTYTLDWTNWRAQLSQAQANFTPSGWAGFEQAIKQSDTLQSIITNKFVVTAVPKAAPVLINQGMTSIGVYSWQFQMPLLITYHGAGNSPTQEVMFDILVVRRPESENIRGLGIQQLIARR